LRRSKWAAGEAVRAGQAAVCGPKGQDNLAQA
jgi:hypothetical protein